MKKSQTNIQKSKKNIEKQKKMTVKKINKNEGK